MYANNILVFDQKYSYGLSIWDIKEKISFFSYEYFRFFNKTLTVKETLQTIIHSHPYKNKQQINEWIDCFYQLINYFDISHQIMDKNLYHLPHYTQRLIVLLAVILKNAPLLILDEPYHFFDPILIKKINHIIDKYLSNRTIIFVSHSNEEQPQCIDKIFQL